MKPHGCGQPTAAAKSWLSAERMRQLAVWQQTNSVKAGHAASDLHLLVTKRDLRLVFRGHFNEEHQVAEIPRLGMDPARAE